MKRTHALSAAIGLAAAIVILPSGAGAVETDPVRGTAPQVSVPAPALAVPVPAETPAPAAVPAPDAGVAAVPVPVPAPVAAALSPPAAGDDHMAELCAAREVFCHVDSSGHYIGS